MKHSFGISFRNGMRLMVACGVALAAIACGGRTRPVPKEVVEGPSLMLSDSLLKVGEQSDTVTLGRLHEGEVVERRFSLLNTGDKPLVILSVETSCGCTEVDFPKEPLMPGQKQPFSFSFDSRGFYGWQLKAITIRTSAGRYPFKLWVTADVI